MLVSFILLFFILLTFDHCAANMGRFSDTLDPASPSGNPARGVPTRSSSEPTSGAIVVAPKSIPPTTGTMTSVSGTPSQSPINPPRHTPTPIRPQDEGKQPVMDQTRKRRRSDYRSDSIPDV